MRVFVYFNLHRHLWSVKALEGPDKGRVIAHSMHVYLSDVTPRVSEAGRQRVLREKRKNVHAGLVGTLRDVPRLGDGLYPITYNPYRWSKFHQRACSQQSNAVREFICAGYASLTAGKRPQVLVAAASWGAVEFLPQPTTATHPINQSAAA